MISNGRKRTKRNELLSTKPQASNVLLPHNECISPKLRVVELDPANGLQFLDVNDDCIEKICKFLPLDDLCSVGQTCKRLQSIAGGYFQRYYPNNYVRIQSFRRRSVFYMYPDEKYVEDLKPFIRNVCIQEYKGSACVKYLKANFCENLREISLCGINCELNELHGIEIKNQLQQLDSLKIVNCSVGDIYGIFLKHCQKLKHLGIDEPIQFNGQVNWTQHTYPTLNSVTYFDEANTRRANFAEFLQKNPQIKSIACKGTDVQSIVFERATNLDFLILCYNSDKDFKRNIKRLTDYSDNNGTKHIKLEFKKHVSLKYFTEIASIRNFYGFRGLSIFSHFPILFAQQNSSNFLPFVQVRLWSFRKLSNPWKS